MKWSIAFYDGVADEIERNWPPGIRTKLAWILEALIVGGPQELGMPHIKALGKGLFEIRAQGKEGIGRGLFCQIDGKRIFILNAFIKKTQKTPVREMDLALKRLKEIKK